MEIDEIEHRIAYHKMTASQVYTQMNQHIQVLKNDAIRYRFLRQADLDSVKAGGIFVGRTPENLVINGIDLDEAIDSELDT